MTWTVQLNKPSQQCCNPLRRVYFEINVSLKYIMLTKKYIYYELMAQHFTNYTLIRSQTKTKNIYFQHFQSPPVTPFSHYTARLNIMMHFVTINWFFNVMSLTVIFVYNVMLFVYGIHWTLSISLYLYITKRHIMISNLCVYIYI